MKKLLHISALLVVQLLYTQSYAAAVMPQVSAGSVEYWYHISFQNGTNMVLQDNGEDAILTTQAISVGADNQLWKFEASATSGEYVFTSKAGRKIYWDGTASRFKAGSDDTPTNIKFIASANTTRPNSWELQRTGSTRAMNPNGGASAGSQIGEWYLGDIGNTIKFHTAPFKTSSGATEYWYQLVFQRYTGNLAIRDNGEDAILTSETLVAGAENQLWKIEASVNPGFYIFTSKAGRKIYWDGTASRFKAGSDDTGVDLKTLMSGNNDYALSWELQRTGSSNGLNPYGGSSAGRQLGETTLGDGGNVLRFISAQNFLRNAITTAQNKLTNTLAGSDPGTYTTADRTTLGNAINTAITALSGSSTDAEYLTAKTNLETAVSTYTNSVITPQLSTPGDERWYYIQGTRPANTYLSSNGAGAQLSSKTVIPDDTQLWKFVTNTNSPANGFAMVNKATGEYLNANTPYNTSINSVATMPTNNLQFIASDIYSDKIVRFWIENTAGSTPVFRLHAGNPNILNWNGNAYDNSSWLILDYNVAQKVFLQTSINDAAGLLAGTTQGSYFGEYTAEARSTLQTAINTAQAVHDNPSATITEIQDQRTAIQAAIATYKAAANSDINGLVSTSPYKYRWYRIKNRNYSSNDIISSNGVAENGGIITQNAGTATDNELWRFEINTGGTAVKIINKATGLAIKENGQSAQSTLVKPASATEFTFTRIDLFWAIGRVGATQYQYLHRDGSSRLVGWESSATASNWALQFVEEAEIPLGIPVAPMVSTTDKPVYYMIQSASNGSVNLSGGGKNYLDHLLYAPTNTNNVNLKHDKRSTLIGAGISMDNALWQLIEEGGKLKLKNKGTGLYMNDARFGTTVSDQTFSAVPISGTTNQYLLKTSTQANPAVAWYNEANGNYIDRWGSTAANSQVAWYFIAPAFSGTSDFSNAADWTNGVVPADNMAVAINSNATIATDKAFNGLHIATGKTLTVNAGKGLTVHNSITGSGTLLLRSDAANGTATVTGNVTGTATVEQHLPAATERTWWYLASPVTGAAWTVFGSNQVGNYSESTRSYSAPFAAAETLEAGRGYVVKMNATEAAVYQFANKTLNNGNISVPLTRSVTGNLDNKRGFNLAGNPYPSYLNWGMAYDAATNVRSTIWYRTQGTSAMEFHTYNAALGVGVPASASGYIPPMQAFWVKVDTDPIEPETVSNGTLNFTNAMRGHANSSENRLKAPATGTLPLLRLELSNGTASDETVITIHDSASDNFDRYDSEKMSNTGAAEVFTLTGTQELVINALAKSEGSKSVRLGIRPAGAGNFTLKATELKNMDDIALILHDHQLNTRTELKLNESYSFISEATATNDRFSVELRAPGATTSVNDVPDQLKVGVSVAGRLTIEGPVTAGSIIGVYNTVGQQVFSQAATGSYTELDRALHPGVYIVKINNTSIKVTVK